MGKVMKFNHVAPREIVDHIGRHKLVLTYRPDAEEDKRWKWTLSIVQYTSYSGAAQNPAMCKVEASSYAALFK